MFALNYFFRDIIRQMERLNQDPVRFEDVKDEIFDMVRPRDPLRIRSGHRLIFSVSL